MILFTIAVRLTSSPAGDDDDITLSPVRLLRLRGLGVCVGGTVHWRRVRLLTTTKKVKEKELINVKVSHAKDKKKKLLIKVTIASDRLTLASMRCW